jgi:gas vesicle protein
MESEKSNSSGATNIAWFVFGTLVGVTAAVLLAPEPGEKTRGRLAKSAALGRKNILQSSQDVFERGRELVERGRDIAQEASEMFERGRRIAEKSFDERL